MSNQNVDLKRAGLKVTLPRLNILSILSESAGEGAHLSAEDVYQRLRDAGDDVGLATVYRVLTQFETAGLVERHNFESGHSVFELATDDHHDHMVDVDNNEVIEFVDEEIEARQHAIAAERGYVERVILPHETRLQLVRALRALRGKRASGPPKKHGNIPL